jgi:hypothetical protein
MKQAVTDVIEKHDPARLIMFLSRMFKIMIGLCIALVFALGTDVLFWNKIHTQDGQIHAIQNRSRLVDRAAYQTCLTTKPRATKLFEGLIGYYQADYDSVYKLVKDTPKGTVTHEARVQRLKNDSAIVETLRHFLPIRCAAKKQDT